MSDKLFEEASGLKGMIDEIECKCRMVTSLGYPCGIEYAEQMRDDLYKYSIRLKQIFVELNNGIPKLE